MERDPAPGTIAMTLRSVTVPRDHDDKRQRLKTVAEADGRRQRPQRPRPWRTAGFPTLREAKIEAEPNPTNKKNGLFL